MKTLQDHIEYLLSRNINAEKENDRLRKELHGSVHRRLLLSRYFSFSVIFIIKPRNFSQP